MDKSNESHQDEPVQSMDQYRYITIEELKRFASERGVHIISSAESATRPVLPRDHLVKLRKVPRFLDLAPEIRNLIYEERESWTSIYASSVVC